MALIAADAILTRIREACEDGVGSIRVIASTRYYGGAAFDLDDSEESLRGMERPQAELAYAKLLDPKLGMFRDLRIDPEGMKTVLRLRGAYGTPRKDLKEASAYIDDSFLKEALK